MPKWLQLTIEYGTQALLLLGILIAGWIAVKIVRSITSKLIDKLGIEVLAEKLGLPKLLYRFGIQQGVAKLGGRVTGWIVWLITFYALFAQLGLNGVNDGIAALLGKLPDLFFALVIFGVGAWAAGKVKSMLASEHASTTQRFGAQLLYYALITLSAIMAMEQLGIEMNLIHQVILVVFAAAGLSASIAFAISSKAMMADLIAGHYARKLLRQGDTIELAEHTGTVHMFNPFSLLLHDHVNDVEVSIPYTTLIDTHFRIHFVDASS